MTLVVTHRDRADAMLQRLLRTARSYGVADTGLLREAFESAMAPRLEALDDDHDPRFLHPGRTALILLQDAGYAEPHGLATAILAETESPELSCLAGPEPDDAPSLLAARAEARALPLMADAEEFAERLLTAPEPIPLVALAEYLDQLRHLRLWAEAERVQACGDVAARILVPVAERVHPVLARRYRWWVRRMVSPTAR